MEDYIGAFMQRAEDTDVLIKGQRKVGSVHMGAIAIECLLKAVIIERFCIDCWNKNSDGVEHGISNPGHDLVKAIQSVPELRRRIPPYIINFINIIQTPEKDYIDMRYRGEIITEELFKDWQSAYKRLRDWILAQRPYLHGSRRGR